jgi:molybdopterin molybdotransferase
MSEQITASCHDEYDPNSLSVDQARARISALVKNRSKTETIPLLAGLGRVLARDVISSINVPPHANSAMDGYALRISDLHADGATTLKVVASIFAGHPFNGQIKAGECVRIMTGAPMPADVDTVIMQERVQINDDDHISIAFIPKKEENVRKAGEDIQQGQVILSQGSQLRPADLGLLASLGVADIQVYQSLKIAFCSTGDELVAPGQTIQAGQIFDSNRYCLHGLLQQLHVDIIDLGIIADDKDAIRQAFIEGSQQADIFITTGGVSVGDADYVKDILAELGEVDFWKIAMKPGRPLAFGQLDSCIFFGLPGNPVSAMVTFDQFLKPAVLAMQGIKSEKTKRLRLRSLSKLRKRPGRVEFQRGILTTNEKGELCVRSTGAQGSHILSSMNQADCYIILDSDSQGAEFGDIVEVEPFFS